jgi:hypothetical protein
MNDLGHRHRRSRSRYYRLEHLNHQTLAGDLLPLEAPFFQVLCLLVPSQDAYSPGDARP